MLGKIKTIERLNTFITQFFIEMVTFECNVNLDIKSNENDLQMSRTESSASSNGFHISLFIDCPKTKKLNNVH